MNLFVRTRLPFLLCLYGCLFTTNVAGQSRIDDHQQLQQDVQRTLHPDEFKTLLMGVDETIVFINESNQVLTKGAAILISETGRNGASQIGLAPIAPYLNDFGWTTILVTAPKLDYEKDIADDTGTPETEPTEPAAPNDLPPPNQAIPSYTSTPVISQSMFQQQEQAFQLLLNAVEEERRNYPGFSLVIAQGTSAAWLAKLYSEESLPLPDAFVAMGINWPQKDLNDQVPEFLARTPAPVLDIYNQFDSDWTITTSKQRQVTAIKSLKLHYRQRELIGQQLDKQQFEYLAREIHGWLTYMGW